MSDPRPRRTSARDAQDASPFARILADLVARVPGARGAALVDGEGETVDYAGILDPYELRVAAAHWQILVADLQRSRTLAPLRSVTVLAAKKSYFARTLPDRYVLMLILGKRAGMSVPDRALAVCVRELAAEAGWNAGGANQARKSLDTDHAWIAVAVECDRKRRPVRVSMMRREGPRARSRARMPSSSEPDVHVLGAVVGLAKRERGYRVRLASGAEITVVCEPGGHWYADETEEKLAGAAARSRGDDGAIGTSVGAKPSAKPEKNSDPKRSPASRKKSR